MEDKYKMFGSSTYFTISHNTSILFIWHFPLRLLYICVYFIIGHCEFLGRHEKLHFCGALFDCVVECGQEKHRSDFCSRDYLLPINSQWFTDWMTRAKRHSPAMTLAMALMRPVHSSHRVFIPQTHLSHLSHAHSHIHAVRQPAGQLTSSPPETWTQYGWNKLPWGNTSVRLLCSLFQQFYFFVTPLHFIWWPQRHFCQHAVIHSFALIPCRF